MTSAGDVRELAVAAREASRVVACATAETRRRALTGIAAELRARRDTILDANHTDVAAAEQKGLPAPMVDRLRLDAKGLEAIARAVEEIAAQPELVGRIEREETRPNGLRLARMRIPLGVICMIYESRPNVTVDAAALCLKAGNACILRGGSEAFASNQALGAAVQAGIVAAGLPAAAITVVPSTDRDAIRALIALEGLIDLVIPRGGEQLIRFVAEHARVPVIKHYKGVCHLYVHAAADLDLAVRLAENGKVPKPSACNSIETILVDRAVAAGFVPGVCARLAELGVELRGDPEVLDVVQRLSGPRVKPATDDDWAAEYLDLIVAIRVVDDLDAALAHIARWGSDHTECIVTTDGAAAERFLREVGSSTVMHNASTRFADGGELGLGAEIGISTTRLHAYGPMGAEGLTTTKFIVRGTGQIRT